MGEIKKPLLKVEGGHSYLNQSDDPAYVIGAHNSHSDILRYVAEDEGNAGLLVLAEIIAFNGTTAKERAEIELGVLNAKVTSLMEFISCGEPFNSLSEQMQGLLNAQLLAMHAYMGILKQRLEIWDE